MLEERLARAVGALERSVAEVDAAERLEALGRRRRRQRTVTVALTLAVAAAVLAAAVVAGPGRADPQAVRRPGGDGGPGR
jgi:hypothetical protein